MHYEYASGFKKMGERLRTFVVVINGVRHEIMAEHYAEALVRFADKFRSSAADGNRKAFCEIYGITVFETQQIKVCP